MFEGEHIPLATLPGMAERTVSIHSMSKTYSVTGWRIGWTIAPPDLSVGIRRVHDFLTVGAAAPLQAAAVVALGFPDAYYRDLVDGYRARRDLLLPALRTAGFRVHEPAGAYYVMTDIADLARDGEDDVAFALRLIADPGVAAVPGSSFFSRPELGRTSCASPSRSGTRRWRPPLNGWPGSPSGLDERAPRVTIHDISMTGGQTMGTTSTYSAGGLDELRSSVSGRIIQPDDGGYDEARRVHNGLIDRRPAIIVRCRSAADAAAALRFARAEGLDISVRGGGHNVAGRAVADDAVMIDLAEMKGIEVDPDARTVRAEGGVLWGELNDATAEHGLAVDGRRDLDHRDRRPDARRRARLADGQVRAGRRQPRVGRAGDGRRRDHRGDRGVRRRTSSGRCAAVAGTSGSPRR